MMNTRIRQYREKLIDLTNEYSDIPVESQYMALQLVINKVIETANLEIIAESENEPCKKPTQE